MTTDPTEPSVPEHRLITSRAEFHAALRETLDEAARIGCRELLLSDADFADWPIGERAVIESLTQWAGAHRSLTMVALHYDAVVARHARFVQWRRQWSHVVQCRAFEEIDAADWPTALIASGLRCVRLFDRIHIRGAVSTAPADLLFAREAVDAVLQRSAEAFPATTLGL